MQLMIAIVEVLGGLNLLRAVSADSVSLQFVSLCVWWYVVMRLYVVDGNGRKFKVLNMDSEAKTKLGYFFLP